MGLVGGVIAESSDECSFAKEVGMKLPQPRKQTHGDGQNNIGR